MGYSTVDRFEKIWTKIKEKLPILPLPPSLAPSLAPSHLGPPKKSQTTEKNPTTHDFTMRDGDGWCPLFCAAFVQCFTFLNIDSGGRPPKVWKMSNEKFKCWTCQKKITFQSWRWQFSNRKWIGRRAHWPNSNDKTKTGRQLRKRGKTSHLPLCCNPSNPASF